MADRPPAETRITQIYEHLELLSAGDPPRHSLFVMERSPDGDRLLLIDPPPDVGERFTLGAESAALFTGPVRALPIPLLQTRPGGVAHISIGHHLLDIHSFSAANLVFFPALGLLCAGGYGSDLTVPRLAPGSSGDEEIEILRTLARMVRSRTIQLFIPHIGSLCDDRVAVMGRLAADVAYLHGLQRVIPPAVRRGETGERLQQIGASLLPENRHTPTALETHRANVETLARG